MLLEIWTKPGKPRFKYLPKNNFFMTPPYQHPGRFWPEPLQIFESGKKFSAFIDCLLFLSFFIHPCFSQKNQNKAPEIRLKKSELLSLFESNKGDKSELRWEIKDSKSIKAEVLVLKNNQRGQKTGTLACRLLIENQENKLLMNRKEVGKKMVYWLSVLPEKEGKFFKLKEETASEFILSEVEKENIVSE